MTFMERVTPVIDETIAQLARKRFIEDPIAGPRYSRQTSIISSAYIGPACADNGAACPLPGDPGRDEPIMVGSSTNGTTGDVVYITNTINGDEHQVVRPRPDWFDKIYRV